MFLTGVGRLDSALDRLGRSCVLGGNVDAFLGCYGHVTLYLIKTTPQVRPLAAFDSDLGVNSGSAVRYGCDMTAA